MLDPTPLSESVSSSYLELSSTAGALNIVSDALGKAVSEIDEGLKKLNLGITSWVQIGYSGPDGPNDSTYLAEDVGYSKISSKWGLSIRTRVGDEQDPQDGERIEYWPFSEAPRHLRLKAIGKIPELLKKLNEEAAKITKELQMKLADAQAVAAAINPTRPKSDLEKKRDNWFAKASTPPAPHGIGKVVTQGGETNPPVRRPGARVASTPPSIYDGVKK